LSRHSPRPRSPVAALPEDSLGFALHAAAGLVAGVLKGRSLDGAMTIAALPTAQRANVMDMVYGTLRRYGRSDYFLSRLLQKKLKQGEVHSLLLVALTLLETRSGDVHTLVDQAVNAAGVMDGGHLRSLVNAVLRNYLRQQETLRQGADGDEVAHWQHPRWWLDLIRQTYPDAWQQVMNAGNSHPPMSLRVNLNKGRRDDYLARLQEQGIAASSQGEAGILLAKPVAVDRLPGFFDGLVSVQDLGAQQAALLLDARPGMRVLDACAAPGGKTAHILERAAVDLLALDAEAKRAARISENLERLGLAAQVRVADCRQVETWWDGRPFERILADVPCSASGVVRRHPDAKWLRRPEDVSSFAATQREIIEALWPLLAPGGRMLYCTCSVFPGENRAQISAFLARHADARSLALDSPQPDLQLLPNAEHDGFYYALLEKRLA